ncbi:MAG: pyridoxal-phosphate dependent enzyme, partial [Victivallales bacterium]|nr:pyridoxal-phosphate dependent enzyme [Victivallales bacterium]
LTGIGSVLKAKFPQMIVVAAEPENAAILAGGAIGSHLQQGIGDGLIPDNLDVKLIDEIATITDDEALQTSRDLALHEGLGVGISSGTNVACALRLAKRLGKGKTVLTVLPDSYDRYYSTPLFQR